MLLRKEKRKAKKASKQAEKALNGVEVKQPELPVGKPKRKEDTVENSKPSKRQIKKQKKNADFDQFDEMVEAYKSKHLAITKTKWFEDKA